jgi:hypothetical protein
LFGYLLCNHDFCDYILNGRYISVAGERRPSGHFAKIAGMRSRQFIFSISMKVQMGFFCFADG